MRLYIVRHGIAIDRDDPKSPADPERYLMEEGIKKTKQIAKGIAGMGATADLLVSSPYVRAMQTAELFADALDYPKQKIRQSNALLPGADPARLFQELAKQKESESVFCFGHAPQLDRLIAEALGLKHQVTALKKSGVALIDLQRVSSPSGLLEWIAVPKMFRKHAEK
jgi:phosphohistidine phosphatase